MSTTPPKCTHDATKTILPLLMVIGTLLIPMGCASPPKGGGSDGGMTQDAIRSHEDVKGKNPVVFHQPLEKTREAALRALTFVGCEIKQRQNYYVSGRRPNKFGLFVGSGGETVEVCLLPKTEGETQVWVDTDLSFVGIAGQQGWDNQVIEEMTNILNKPAKPQ